MVLRRVLLIGDHRHCEFSAATNWLAEHTLLSVVETPAAAMAALRHPAKSQELVVVAQARPGQFSQAEIESVHRLAPLARLAVLAGSWCEGEMRTGHPWPGVLRIYWHQGEARLRELLAESNLWSCPRTATEVERLLDQSSPSAAGGQQLVAIATEHSIAYHGLAATCVDAGFSTVWVAPGQTLKIHGAAAGIWDETQHRESQHADSPNPLDAFADHLQRAPIVALVNFPRLSDYQRLQAQGIRQVIAKPFMNSDLIGVIQQQLAITPTAAAQAVA